MNISTAENYLQSDKKVAFIIWTIFFCFSVCAALIFQKVLLQIIPSLQAVNGLLPTDSRHFHNVAIDLAQRIHTYGWSAWTLYPTPNTSGNVAILGALYALFGNDPSLMVPVNAAIHALGGMLIYSIVRELSATKTIGLVAGVIASTLFVVFPSSLNWYGQIHKDGFVIAGSLIILLTWVKAIKNPVQLSMWLYIYILQIVGLLLVAGSRPYCLLFFSVVSFGALLIFLVINVCKKTVLGQIKVLLFFALSVSFALTSIYIASKSGVVDDSEAYYKNWKSKNNWQWQDAKWLPDILENYISSASKTRAGLIEYGQIDNAKSLMDQNKTPQNILEVVTYLPRALQIAVFAPFPTTWFSEKSIVRLVATGEMAVYYMALLGILLLLRSGSKLSIYTTIYFALFFLLVYGYTLANLGTLYRVRYAYEFILISLGVIGWITWLDKNGRLDKLLHWFEFSNLKEIKIQNLKENNLSRDSTVRAAFLVVGLTLLTFLGFFLRDILMTRAFGLMAALDNFYIALTMPMFIVSVLSMPVGSALIPIYNNLKEQIDSESANQFLSGLSFWVVVLTSLICIVFFIFEPKILKIFQISKSVLDVHNLMTLSHLSLSLLFFSGLVVIGNAVLNAHQNSVKTSSFQFIVPVTAVGSLLIFGKEYGVFSVMWGMMLGQLLNLVLVTQALRSYGISLVPRYSELNNKQLLVFIRQYIPQVASAFFLAFSLPLATFLAISLSEGAVSSINLGTKLVLFVTGILGAVITIVVLPYFSSLVAKKHLIEARRELSMFLFLATMISVPISFGLYFYAQKIIMLIFHHTNLNDAETGQIVRVMQYSIVQVPFFACNSLLLRFANAANHNSAVLVSAILGLFMTIGASLLLVSHMGVAGIALGTSIGMLFSTIWLVVMLVKYQHINFFDVILLLLSWLLFLTLLMCFHFQSIPSIYVTTFSYLILVVAYINSTKLEPSVEGN